MEILGIPVLIQDHGRELKNTDEDLRAMAAIALSNRSWIKTTGWHTMLLPSLLLDAS